MTEMMAGMTWWGWTLLVAGAIAVVTVFAALFLPDWGEPALSGSVDAPSGSKEFLFGLSAFLNVPVRQGGEVEIFQNGDAFFPAILGAIRAARATVNFQVYIFEPDDVGREFMEAFKERAQAGVEVRILLDAFGSFKLRKRHRRELKEAGCRIELFRPLRLSTLVRAFRRDHRRAIIVDGHVAFTGGAAVANKWRGNAQNPACWRDSMTRVRGPLAAGIQTAFGRNWAYATGELLAGPRFFPPSAADEANGDSAHGDSAHGDSAHGDSAHGEAVRRGTDRGGAESGGDGVPGDGCHPAGMAVVSSPSDAAQPIRILFWTTFHNARKRLFISSSYFIPDTRLRSAVCERAAAGVDVRILVPGAHTDAQPVRYAGRSFYDELLAAGVRIFEYRPTMMHAKSVVADGIWSVVGSANMDERSMELNEENCLGIADPGFAEQVERGLLGDFERAEEIHLDAWRKRSRLKRLLERLAKGLIEQY